MTTDSPRSRYVNGVARSHNWDFDIYQWLALKAQKDGRTLNNYLNHHFRRVMDLEIARNEAAGTLKRSGDAAAE